MRVTITSRIFAPEPSAASFRLAALAKAHAQAGHDVTVLTVKPERTDEGEVTPQQSLAAATKSVTYRVRRFPVLRDKSGYVRGYVQYMSFDIPLFFRLVLGKSTDLVITEPPPTTGFFVRLATKVRRTPYVYYAADVWSDAAESTGASRFVVRVVRRLERFALSGAQAVLSVNDGVTKRVLEIAPSAQVHTIGNGIDTNVFTVDGPVERARPYFVYAGTASEWQGAALFIDAFAEVLHDYPEARLVFVGQGSDWANLRRAAASLPAGSVEFLSTVPPTRAARLIRGATASLASIRPDAGYNFAFPTKVFASWASGTPVVYAGEGVVHTYMADHAAQAALGAACAYDVSEVAQSLRDTLEHPLEENDRANLGRWAGEAVSLSAVADRAVQVCMKTEASA